MTLEDGRQDPDARSVLFVHAHPDDETINNGATMAKYAAEGVHVTLVTCTLGEEGEVLVPELEHLAADREDRLGEHRIGELAAAMKELGVADHRFLGGPGRYRDSGMMGTPPNERPDAFWQADVDQAAGLLVAVIREVRPQVVVTYNEIGGYGHPDHIQAHRVAMRAVELAADPDFRAQGDGSEASEASTGNVLEPYQVTKVYWNTIPRSVLQAGIDALRAAGETTGFASVESADELPFVADDETVTTAIDAGEFAARKTAAMRAYPTQMSVDGPFFALSDNVGVEMMRVEYYQLVRGELGPTLDRDGREDDLFDGIN